MKHQKLFTASFGRGVIAGEGVVPQDGGISLYINDFDLIKLHGESTCALLRDNSCLFVEFAINDIVLEGLNFESYNGQ
jgi:hypothetical protein